MKPKTGANESKTSQSSLIYRKPVWRSCQKLSKQHTAIIIWLQESKNKIERETETNLLVFPSLLVLSVSNQQPVLKEAWKSDFQ